MGTGPVGIDLEAVEVGEVAVAGNAGLAMLVIKLVVAGRGPREKFESAIRQIERLLKVRILAYLVLQISEERDGVRLHILNLIRSGLLGLPQRGAGVGGLGVGADFSFAFSPLGSVSPGWQAMSPTTASTGDLPVVA
jgi:hypothetical protein